MEKHVPIQTSKTSNHDHQYVAGMIGILVIIGLSNMQSLSLFFMLLIWILHHSL